MADDSVNYTELFDRTMYHTQEKWHKRLKFPIKTINQGAWLGIGYYFWEKEEDAIDWGRNSKKKTGYFEIYTAKITSDKILDTVFNRAHYEFYQEQVDEVAKRIIKKTGIKATPQEINDYFKERAYWDVDGILFQDIPISQNKSLVKGFFYKKRIQLVVYNTRIIFNFVFASEWSC